MKMCVIFWLNRKQQMCDKRGFFSLRKVTEAHPNQYYFERIDTCDNALVRSFFAQRKEAWRLCLIPHEPQTAPRCNPKCSCGLCGLFCYVVNGLQYHTPNPYKIAFSSFTIRVRISCSSVLQSKSRRWISESAVEAECVRLSTRRSSADMPRRLATLIYFVPKIRSPASPRPGQM